MKLKSLIPTIQVFNLEAPAFVQTPGANGQGKPESMTIRGFETVDVIDETAQCVEIQNALKPPRAGKKPTLKIVT